MVIKPKLKGSAKRSGNGSLGPRTGASSSKNYRLIARPFLLIVLAIMISSMLRAAASDEDLAKLAAEADVSLSAWDSVLNVKSGIGYKDNPTLSFTNARTTGLFNNGVDYALIRLPLDDWEFHVVLSGEDERYWQDVGSDGESVTHDDLWAVGSEIKRDLGSNWQVGLGAQYAYENQVLDISTLANQPLQPPTKVEGHTINFRPFIQRSLGSNHWVKVEFYGQRQFFDTVDSFFYAGPRLSSGWDYGHGSELVLAYSALHYWYDHQNQTDSSGAPIDNTSLRAWKHEASLEDQHNWDRRSRWQTLVKLMFDYYADNAAGYYNYLGYSARGELHYRSKTWDARGSAEVGYNQFLSQNSATDTQAQPPLLRKTHLLFEIELEKDLFKARHMALKAFLKWENEDSLSDSLDEVYHSNSVIGGLNAEF